MGKKTLFLLLLVCGFAVGCQKTATTDEKQPQLLTITAGKQSDENYARYAPGEDINNNPMIKLGEDELGISIQYTIRGSDYDDYVNQIRLALTGAAKLPDVIPVYDHVLLDEMIESGQVQAIDQALKDYLPERLKKIYDKFPASFYPVTKYGKTYGLAITPVLGETEILVIRQDWLDKLGLTAPTNLQEFAEVIQAFSEKDPDGNGLDDTYGFAYSGDGIYSTGWLGDPAMLFSANTGQMIPGNWEEDIEGNLAYGSIQPGNKETLALMADWYQNGWLAADAAVTNDWNAMLAFRDGKAGMYVGRPSQIEDSIAVTEKFEGAKIGVYPTIRQNNGQPTYQRAEENDGWFLFRKDFADIEAFFAYYDWLYDVAFGTGNFQYGYLENGDYDIVDDQPVFVKENFDPPKKRDAFDPTKAIVTKNSPALDQMLPYHKAVTGGELTNASEREKAELYQTKLKPLVEGGNIAYEHQGELTPNKFRGHLPDDLQNVFSRFQTKENQVYSDIIRGKVSVTAFDEFVKDWHENGGKEITEAVNQWYRQVKAGEQP